MYFVMQHSSTKIAIKT